MSDPTRIKELIVTPIAFRDPPLLNSNGVHEPLALRIILQLVLEDGTVGLGVELDHEGLARLHRLYLDSGVRSRDDTGYMQRFQPDYELRLPRW